ncbi:DUF2087 domain-containing protein [Deinococcus arcticus]|uniref:DUF2087 domain-containing protein n=1 Tax=Deinococcus arcticus TaxID=2136176 RepID=A0A2T3WAX0_9DEIO|nr:DUF2087 domain-containing protein [Deinococcus arcticus]PTA69045.1 hypothetical protein C8263_04435 [Deinococcus arcticus]
MTKSIHDFQDEHGRITGWPSDRRRAHQLAILDYLTGLFEPGVSYDPAQVQGVLADHSTLEDPGILLTELVEADYLATDGQVYWRADGRPGARPASPGERG